MVIVRFAVDNEQEEVEELAATDPETKDFKYLWRRYGNWGKINPIIAFEDVDGEIIGLHAVTFGTRNHYANSYYQLVAPAFRGQGVGGKMVDQMIKSAKSAECTRLKFKTPFDTDGERFWRGFGLMPFAQDEKQFLFDVDISNVQTLADLRSVTGDIPMSAMKGYERAGVTILGRVYGKGVL